MSTLEMAPRKRLTSVRNTASALGICPATTWALIRDGRLRAVKLNGRTFVPDEEIDRFVASLPAAV